MSSENDFVKEITNRDEDWSQWYGTSSAKRSWQTTPYVAVWLSALWLRHLGGHERRSDRRIKETGTKTPTSLFIPESLLQKEADHVEGFARKWPDY